jgi:hypothetical protein
MVPVDAPTRYLISDGENGPPLGPEKAMLVGGVTINAGGDCPARVCAAPLNSIADGANKVIEGIRLGAIMLT